jgi:hypothetical protein
MGIQKKTRGGEGEAKAIMNKMFVACFFQLCEIELGFENGRTIAVTWSSGRPVLARN